MKSTHLDFVNIKRKHVEARPVEYGADILWLNEGRDVGSDASQSLHLKTLSQRNSHLGQLQGTSQLVQRVRGEHRPDECAVFVENLKYCNESIKPRRFFERKLAGH